MIDKLSTSNVRQRETKWYGYRPDLMDKRDHRLAAPAPGTAQPPEGYLDVSLLPPIRNQGAQGSCTGFATRTLGQYIRKLEGQPDEELSPRFIYYNARMIEGTVKYDAGAEIRDCIKQVNHLGFASEKDCPYTASNWTKRPSNRSFVDARQDFATEYLRPEQTVAALKQAVLDKLGFVFGFAVYENFESDEVTNTGLVGMPRGGLLGGHAVVGAGFNDNIVLGDQTGGCLCINSWDSDWGCKHPHGQERGYFWLPYTYMTDNNLADDFWVIRKIS